MTCSLNVACVWVLRGLRLGPLRLTLYGLCAAFGLIAAMALAQRCARYRSVSPEAVWDAGLFAILACFVSSRLLLVVHDPQAFARYPLLVLGLPSLTLGGLALASLLLWIYLRRKRLGLVPLLDVFAAPAALLAALLELGHALDGSEPGMPTALPWGVREAAGQPRLHAVAVYGVVAALGLAAVLWRRLQRSNTSRIGAGKIAGLGLLLGGAVAFLLAMLTQPIPALVDLWIEPGQWVALVAMLAGAVLWSYSPKLGHPSLASETWVSEAAHDPVQPQTPWSQKRDLRHPTLLSRDRLPKESQAPMHPELR